MLDRAVDACAAAGLYTVIDLHAVPGAQNHGWHSDNPFHKPLFWQHPHFQDRAVTPVGGDRFPLRAARGGRVQRPQRASRRVQGPPWRPFYRRAVAAIRAVDGRHMVFLDGNRYATEFDGFGEPFENAVYAVHQYPAGRGSRRRPVPGADRGGGATTPRSSRRSSPRMTAYMREHGLPVWVGEFGPVYGAGAERDAQQRRLLADQIDAVDRRGAGWSLWTYKDIGVQGLVVDRSRVAVDAPHGSRAREEGAARRRPLGHHHGRRARRARSADGAVRARVRRVRPVRVRRQPVRGAACAQHLLPSRSPTSSPTASPAPPTPNSSRSANPSRSPTACRTRSSVKSSR